MDKKEQEWVDKIKCKLAYYRECAYNPEDCEQKKCYYHKEKDKKSDILQRWIAIAREIDEADLLELNALKKVIEEKIQEKENYLNKNRYNKNEQDFE